MIREIKLALDDLWLAKKFIHFLYTLILFPQRYFLYTTITYEYILNVYYIKIYRQITDCLKRAWNFHLISYHRICIRKLLQCFV